MGSIASRTVLAWGLLLGTLSGTALAHSGEQVQVCAACHNRDGNSVVPDYPRLAGLDAKYIARQMSDFKSGKRTSPVMGAIASTMNASTIEELAEHFGEQQPGPSKVLDPVLAAKGKIIFDDGIVGSAVPACSGCHGSDGAGDAKYPRLAGQHTAYVIRQLDAFKSGERANDLKGAMSAVAKRMTEAEIQAVSHYVAELGKESK